MVDPSARSVSAMQNLMPTRPNIIHRLLGIAYTRALSLVWPDIYRKWARSARAEATGWKDWAPDVVVASVGPFSALILGTKLAKHFQAKLAIDYRDLLTLSTYYQHGAIRRKIDGTVERRSAATASILATVSQPLADELRGEYNRKSIVVTNGYDPSDFVKLTYTPDPKVLHIVYCGWVIPHRRDPRPFLQGLAQVVKDQSAVKVVADFYGPPSSEVMNMVSELGLEQHVVIHGKVNHVESLRIQANSDALLLLLWNNPGEAGVLSGKIFEYIGAGRPVLMTGFEGGAAATLIQEARLGLVSNDPTIIASHLRRLVEEKERTGKVEAPNIPDRSLYTRASQGQKFLNALEELQHSD